MSTPMHTSAGDPVEWNHYRETTAHEKAGYIRAHRARQSKLQSNRITAMPTILPVLDSRYFQADWWNRNHFEIDREDIDGVWWTGTARAETLAGDQIVCSAQGYCHSGGITIEHVDDVEYE